MWCLSRFSLSVKSQFSFLVPSTFTEGLSSFFSPSQASPWLGLLIHRTRGIFLHILSLEFHMITLPAHIFPLRYAQASRSHRLPPHVIGCVFQLRWRGGSDIQISCHRICISSQALVSDATVSVLQLSPSSFLLFSHPCVSETGVCHNPQ